MEQAKIAISAKIFLGIFLFILLNYVFIGITTIPTEGDSLAYHIPIARSILTGGVLYPPNHGLALGYYPGAAELVLSLFILFHIPLNLFNVLGIGLLFYLLRRLGIGLSLSSQLATIFAVVVTTLPSVIRLYPNQTVDIWVAVFFTAVLILLERSDNSVKYFLVLGVSIGFLLGSKYSGPFYLAILFILYFNTIKRFVDTKNVFALIPGVAILGLSWYFRNIVLTGNPYYPANLPFLKGKSGFKLQNWQPWKTVIFYRGGWLLMIHALVSEFLVWSFALFSPILVVLKKARINIWTKFIVLGISNFFIYLLLPSWPENIVSDLRYTYPAFIPLILAIFLYAKSIKRETELIIISLLSLVAVIPQLDYRPKLFLIFILVISFYIIFEKKITSLLKK